MIRSILRLPPRPISLCVALFAATFTAPLSTRGQQPNLVVTGQVVQSGQLDPASGPSLVHKVAPVGDRIEMIVDTSRILTLDQKIPQAQVNNPDLLDVVPLSPNQVQISAKKPGVTQVNLWGEDKRIYTVDVIVTGDGRALTYLLHAKFPRSTLDVTPIGSAVYISGYVDQQDAVPKIIQIAEQFYPKVINNMTVSGVQQVLLHVKVMEVSRTKLRNLGFDFAKVTNGNLLMSGISGLISTASGSPFGPPGAAPDNLVKFSVLTNGGSSAFFGVLNALRQDGLTKVLAEPNLVAVSGRPAYFNEGGQIGYQLTSGLTGTTTGFVNYGTRVDFVPIVLGNGRIHLDVRPSVSELDAANTPPNGIPATKSREVETGVEMKAGQTLAIAGLVQQRNESTNTGLPWVSEVPYLGVPFRTVQNSVNEVELLILVTPELVDAMDASQVPACGPGSETATPSDWELFFMGHLEVPNCCAGGNGNTCAACSMRNTDNSVAGEARVESNVSGSQQNQYTSPRSSISLSSTRPNNEIPEPGFIGPIGYDVLN